MERYYGGDGMMGKLAKTKQGYMVWLIALFIWYLVLGVLTYPIGTLILFIGSMFILFRIVKLFEEIMI